MSKILKVLEAFCIVFVCSFILLIVIGMSAFFVNFACGNEITTFQTTSFVICFFSAVVGTAYMKLDN